MIFKLIFLAFFTLVTFSAKAQWYFGNDTAQNLTNSITYDAGTILVTGALDPSATAVNAPPASMYFSTSGTVYIKQDSGLTTNWLPIGVTTPSSLTSINGQSGPAVSIVSGTAGTDFAVASAANTIILNLPTASAANTGKLSSTDWSTFNNKEPAITATTSADYYRGDKTFQNLGTAVGSVSATFTNKTFDADGAGNSITNIENADIKALAGIDASKIADGSVSSTEFEFINTVTSNVQTQLDGKEPSITTLPIAKGGTNSSTALNNNRVMQSSGGAIVEAASITGNRALISDANGIPTHSTTTATEIGFVNGVTSAIQTQLDGKEPTITVLPLSKGGTNKNMTAVNGGVVYTDADSQEVSAAGTSNQVLQSNGAAAPTWSNRSVLAQNQAGADVTLEEIQAPNLSLTQTATNTHLLETGNKNILQNASFEHSTVLTGWTSGAGTTARETTIEIDGDASLKVTLSAQALSISQDSTRYQAQFADGVDGLVGAWVKTSVSNIYVCARAAGVSLVSSTFSNCVAVQNNNKWAFYQIPTILGATSNGVEVASYNSSGVSVAVTGDVYIDDALVGAFPTRQTVDQSKIAGESYFAGTTSCIWTRSSTTVGAFTTDTDCPGPTIAYSSMGSWQTTDANLPRQTINNLPAGVYKAKFIVNINMDAANAAAMAINDGTTTCEPIFTTALASADDALIECTFVYTSPGNRVFELYGGSVASVLNINSNQTAPRSSAKFILEYFGNSSIYSASNSDTDWASCGHTTSDFTNFGTVSSIDLKCKREGSDLLMRGSVTCGTTLGAEARISLKFNGSTLTSASNISTLEGTGSVGNAPAATGRLTQTLIEPSVTYMTLAFSDGNGGGNLYSKANANAICSNGTTISVVGRFPISGWQNSNVIVGSFKEVVTTPGTTKPVFVSANVPTSGTVTDDEDNFINGNCVKSGTSNFTNTCTFTTNYWASTPKCWADPLGNSGDALVAVVDSVSTTTLVFMTLNATTPVNRNSNIFCKGSKP